MDTKSRSYLFARMTLFFKRCALVVVEYPILINYLLMDGQTDRRTGAVLIGQQRHATCNRVFHFWNFFSDHQSLFGLEILFILENDWCKKIGDPGNSSKNETP